VNLDVSRFLESMDERQARFYVDALDRLAAAVAGGDRDEIAAARARLVRVVQDTMGVAEVMGAALMLREAAGSYVEDAKDAGVHMRRSTHDDLVLFRDSGVIPTLANVTFEQALQDLLDRTPVFLRDAAERTAQNIARLYSQGHVIAFARSAELAVTQKVQQVIATAIKTGVPEIAAGNRIVAAVEKVRTETEPWTRAYARMAFRTNINTAATAGRFRQALDPDVARVVPAFRFDAVGDSDTRPNHKAADGRIWTTRNPVWQMLAPPLGYNCRCNASLVTLPMLRRMGRVSRAGTVLEDSVPPGAHPDPGFRHGPRPDLGV